MSSNDPEHSFGAAAEHLAAVDVPGGEVGQRSAAVVFVVDPYGAGLAGGQAGMAAAAGLDGGLLIGADDVVARAERLSVPDAGVEVQHPLGLRREGGIADEDPGLVLPRLEGVFA